MSRYVYVHISLYICILYDQISWDMNFLPSISVHICAYKSISVHICAYLWQEPISGSNLRCSYLCICVNTTAPSPDRPPTALAPWRLQRERSTSSPLAAWRPSHGHGSRLPVRLRVGCRRGRGPAMLRLQVIILVACHWQCRSAACPGQWVY